MEIYQVLSEIQAKLKVPKNQYNNFGKYKYRNAEDIQEAVKPLLKEYECLLLLKDEVEFVGERHYIKATATLISKDGKEVNTQAYARESLNKKGMDEAQITGATSSYARKYALNGLFAIDDTKDSDYLNSNKEYTQKSTTSNNDVNTLKKKFRDMYISIGLKDENVIKILDSQGFMSKENENSFKEFMNKCLNDNSLLLSLLNTNRQSA